MTVKTFRCQIGVKKIRCQMGVKTILRLKWV